MEFEVIVNRRSGGHRAEAVELLCRAQDRRELGQVRLIWPRAGCLCSWRGEAGCWGRAAALWLLTSQVSLGHMRACRLHLGDACLSCTGEAAARGKGGWRRVWLHPPLRARRGPLLPHVPGLFQPCTRPHQWISVMQSFFKVGTPFCAPRSQRACQPHDAFQLMSCKAWLRAPKMHILQEHRCHPHGGFTRASACRRCLAQVQASCRWAMTWSSAWSQTPRLTPPSASSPPGTTS